MLRSFKVRTLVLSAIPDLIDTWTSGFDFKPVNDDEKQQLSTINLMLFPGTALLKKNLCQGFEMSKPEDETFSPSREDLRHAVDLRNMRNSQQPDHSCLTAGIDLVVGTTSQDYANLEVSEKDNCRQPNLPALSSETLIIVANGDPDDVTVAVCGSGDSNVLASDLFSDVKSSAANNEVRDVEDATTGIDDSSSIEVSAQCKELPSGSTTRWIPSEAECNVMDFRVDSINGKRDCNSLTVVCNNEISYRSEPGVDSTKDILDPVGPVAHD